MPAETADATIVRERAHAEDIVAQLMEMGPETYHACDTEVADM